MSAARGLGVGVMWGGSGELMCWCRGRRGPENHFSETRGLEHKPLRCDQRRFKSGTIPWLSTGAHPCRRVAAAVEKPLFRESWQGCGSRSAGRLDPFVPLPSSTDLNQMESCFKKRNPQTRLKNLRFDTPLVAVLGATMGSLCGLALTDRLGDVRHRRPSSESMASLQGSGKVRQISDEVRHASMAVKSLPPVRSSATSAFAEWLGARDTNNSLVSPTRSPPRTYFF